MWNVGGSLNATLAEFAGWLAAVRASREEPIVNLSLTPSSQAA